MSRPTDKLLAALERRREADAARVAAAVRIHAAQVHADRVAAIAARDAENRAWCDCGWHQVRKEGDKYPTCREAS